MNRPGVCKVPDGSGEQGKMEETGCEIICGAPTTLAVKGTDERARDDPNVTRHDLDPQPQQAFFFSGKQGMLPR